MWLAITEAAASAPSSAARLLVLLFTVVAEVEDSFEGE